MIRALGFPLIVSIHESLNSIDVSFRRDEWKIRRATSSSFPSLLNHAFEDRESRVIVLHVGTIHRSIHNSRIPTEEKKSFFRFERRNE